MCTCYIYRASLSLLGSPQPMGMSVKGQHTFEILKIEKKNSPVDGILYSAWQGYLGHLQGFSDDPHELIYYTQLLHLGKNRPCGTKCLLSITALRDIY